MATHNLLHKSIFTSTLGRKSLFVRLPVLPWSTSINTSFDDRLVVVYSFMRQTVLAYRSFVSLYCAILSSDGPAGVDDDADSDGGSFGHDVGNELFG